MTDKMPALLVDETPEAAWALDNPKSIAGRVTRAREEGYVNLTPFQRQFALEFVLTGTSLKKIARVMDLPYPFVSRMYNDPIVRAYISDMQKEVAAHRLINDQWVENQIMQQWPKLTGEEAVDIVTAKGCSIKKKKYHSAEVASILKHFSGISEQQGFGKAGGNINVQLNFGDILNKPPAVTINLGEDDK